MEGKKVNEIANCLGISIGTVLSRLDVGRKKIKAGMENMEYFTTSSFKPFNLELMFSGIFGINNEPLHVIAGVLEQNILILSYEEPITIKEISEQMGISTAYVDEVVEKLINNDFMKKQKNKVYTNFLIIDDDVIKKRNNVQKLFINKTFKEVKLLFDDLIDEYRNMNILNKFNDSQLYIYATISVFQQLRPIITDILKLLKCNDYPDRLDGGKWFILYGHKTYSSKAEVSIVPILNFVNFVPVNSCEHTLILYTNVSEHLVLRDKNMMKLQNIGRILFGLHNGNSIDPEKKQLIPELKTFGLIKECNNSLIANIPVISLEDYERLIELNKKYGRKYFDIMGDKLIDMLKVNAIDMPKRINPVSPSTVMVNFDGMSLSYFLKAVEEGIVDLNKNKNHPIAMLIDGKVFI